MLQFDVILKHIGEVGISQVIVCVIISYVTFLYGFNSFATVFIAYTSDVRCNVPLLDNTTAYLNLTESDILNLTTPYDANKQDYDGCLRYGYDLEACQGNTSCVNTSYPTISCDKGYHYDRSLFSETIVTEFDLVCDQKYLAALSTSLYYGGMMVGSLIFGYFSDKFGRKTCCLVSYIVCIGIMFGVTFSPSIELYIMFRACLGAFCFGANIGMYVYVMEIVGKDFRAIFGTGCAIVYALGYMTLSGFSYNWRNWREMMFSFTILSTPFALLLFFIPESPRWLFAHNKERQGMKVTKMLARINGRSVTEDTLEKARKAEEQDELNVKDRTKYNMLDLFRTRRMRIMTISIMFNWFVNSFVYYGISLNAGAMPGDIFVNNTLSGVFDILANIVCILLINRIGRRILISVSFFVAGLGLLASVVVNEYAGNDEGLLTLGLVFGFTAKFGISASFSVIYNLTIELYPTLLRSNALGIGSFSARVAGIVAPYFIVLQDYVVWLPNVVFGVLGVIAGLISLAFPETNGHYLMETIEEAEAFYKNGNWKYQKKKSSQFEKVDQDDPVDEFDVTQL